MEVPIWLLATILYLIALVWSFTGHESRGLYDLSELWIFAQWMGWTIAYLVFWIIYLSG